MPVNIDILEPVAPNGSEVQPSRRTLDRLDGKVIGFIDNGKPNFSFFIEDLTEVLTRKYRVSSIVKHRKRGSVPVDDGVVKEFSRTCDAVITGSGD